MTTLESRLHAQTLPRRRLARYLSGEGIELGPGHEPYPAPYPGSRVRYVDRWEPERNAELFPELNDAAFPQPDIVCNLDVDRLSAVDSDSVDFVIASHVLEHLAEPLGLLDDVHRVLRPGGVVLILLPDRRRTFDARRPPTPLSELVRKHASRRTGIDDEEIAAFLAYADPGEYRRLQESLPEERKAILDLHRLRSIHVHCWTEEEFAQVLGYCIEELGHRWEFMDGIVAADEGRDGLEFGYVLRKQLESPGHEAPATRFEAVWHEWLAERRALNAQRDAANAELVAARAELEAYRRRFAVRLADRLAHVRQRSRGPES